jgi:hypothetical protein
LRLPSKSAQALPDCFLGIAKLYGNRTIAEASLFQLEYRPISPLDWWRTSLRGTAARSPKRQETAGLDPFLVSSQGSRRTPECVSDVVLIRVTRFEQRHHRALFSDVVSHVIVHENKPLKEYRPLGTLGINADTIVEDNGSGWRARELKKSTLLSCHGSISMTDHAPTAKMKKPTVFGPHPKSLYQSRITFMKHPHFVPQTTSGAGFVQSQNPW